MPFTQVEPDNERFNSKEKTERRETDGADQVITSETDHGSIAARKSDTGSLKARARERSRARRRVAAALLSSLTAVLVGSLILRIAAQMMGLMLQSYSDKLNLSLATTGFITASFFIAELLGAPVFGALSDRFGRKKFMLLGPILGAIAVQITSVTTVIWLLVFTRMLEGLSTASSVPATLGYISEATSGRPRLRARVIGLFEITFVGGMALGAAIGGYVWHYFGNEAIVAGLHLTSPAFSVNGLVYLISLAVFVYGLKNLGGGPSSSQNPDEYKKWSHYRAILKSRRVWLLVPAWLAINSIIGMWFNFSIRILTDKKYVNQFGGQRLMGYWSDAQREVYVGLGIFLIIFTSGILVWSFLMGRYRKTSVMLIASGGIGIILPAIYIMNHHDSFSSPTFYLLLGVLLVGVLTLSGFAPAALTYLADVTETHSEDRGSIMGLYSVFLGVGQLLGVAAGGLFADWNGIDGMVMLSAIFGVITTFSLLSLHRRSSLSTARAALPTSQSD